MRGGAAFTAVVRVRGAPEQLEGFRERVRWLMVRDIDAEPFSEHHGGEGLEYRFELSKGVPFPAFAAATEEFPGLRVEAEWRNEARSLAGRAVIEQGRLIENSTEALGMEALGVDVAVAADGALVLALACRSEGGAVAGYAASAARHAFLRYAPRARQLRIAEDAGSRWTALLRFDAQGRLAAREALDEPLGEALPPLEALAFDFAGEWLWYDEGPPQETMLERARYAEYGYAVRGANVKSEALARLRRAGAGKGGALRHSNLDADASAAREALLAGWLETNNKG